jgi:hypothetical protein
MSRWIDSKTIKTGRNAEHPSYVDNKYIKCRHCGFICHLNRDSRASINSREGSGVSFTLTGSSYDGDRFYDDNNIEYDDVAYYDPIVSRGCPLCGTLLYYKENY